ncbi:hypothetical protein [Candidiatus Paracoxiella cheracis]|uniref:hypothetical protein n=1 Tax=Candidiatus Paracoxiella cheracis TaxID=3405120 RepID=UPI003BF5B98C
MFLILFFRTNVVYNVKFFFGFYVKQFLIIFINLSKVQNTENRLVIISIGFAKGFEAMSDICYALIRQHERVMYIALSQILKGAIMLVSFLSAIYFTHNLGIACLCIAFSWFLILVAFDCPIAIKMTSIDSPIKKFYFSLHFFFRNKRFKKIKKLVYMGIPLGTVAGLNSINTNIPKYFIWKILGNKMLGYFTPLSYIFNISLVIIGLLFATTLPRLARYYNDHDDKKFYALTIKLIMLAIFIGLASMLIAYFFAPQILSLFFGKIYSTYANVLFYLMLAATFNYVAIIFIYLLTAIRTLKIQVILFSLAVIITATLTYVYIYSHQLMGAAIAETVVGAWLMLSFGQSFFSIQPNSTGIQKGAFFITCMNDQNAPDKLFINS